MTDLNAAIVDWVMSLFETVPQQAGDTDAIRQQAEDIRQFAGQIRASYANMNSGVHGLGASWSGAAADAQSRAWSQHVMLAEQAASTMDHASGNLQQYSDRADQVVSAILSLALEFLEQFLICSALTIVLNYLADLLFVGRLASLIEQILALFQRLGALIDEFTNWMAKFGTLADRLGQIINVLLREYVWDAIEEYPINLAAYYLPDVLSGNPQDGGPAGYVGSLFLPMLPAIAMYGADNLIFKALEDNTWLGAVKAWIEGSSNSADLGAARAETRIANTAEEKPLPPVPTEEKPLPPVPAEGKPLPLTPLPIAPVTPKTFRQLVYVYLKEWAVNASFNNLYGVTIDHESPAYAAFNAWAISGPLSGFRKAGGDIFKVNLAYGRMSEGQALWTRELSVMTGRALAYASRNLVRTFIEDSINGTTVYTQNGSYNWPYIYY